MSYLISFGSKSAVIESAHFRDALDLLDARMRHGDPTNQHIVAECGLWKANVLVHMGQVQLARDAFTAAMEADPKEPQIVVLAAATDALLSYAEGNYRAGGWPIFKLTGVESGRSRNKPEGCPILRALCEGWDLVNLVN